MAFDPQLDPLAPPPQEYPKTVYVDAAKPAPQSNRTEGQVALVVNSPEEEQRALAGEPLEAPVEDRIPEPTIQERQAYEKVVAYERQSMTPGAKARADKLASKAAPKASKAQPVRKAAKKVAKKAKAGKKAGKR
jgi:hypothetical protein